MYEDVEEARPAASAASSQRPAQPAQPASGQKAAEARLANLHEERKRKKFWDDFRRREERFQRCQSSGKDYKATARDFFTRSFSKGFRRSNYDTSSGSQMRNTNMRHAVLGSTDGFKRGLSHSHGQPVPEQTLRRAFREIDMDQDGLISVRELTRALRRCGVDASRKTVERILQDCGYDAAGQLSADQFVRFFRATEHLVWSVDDEYNPVDSCCTYCGRFLLFLLLIAILVMAIILLRIESGTEIFVGLLIGFLATIGVFVAVMIPVICVPLRRAMKLGQQRRVKEQAKPQKVQRAKTVEAQPKSGLTWLEDFYTGPPAIRGSRSEPQNLSTEVEAYNPEQYRVAQDAATRSITLTDRNQMTISLSGTNLGLHSRTPSDYAQSINCGAFNSTIDGTASVSCKMGVYTLDASGCGPRGCVAGAGYLAQLGSREINTTLAATLASEESTTRTCASVVPGWTGTFTVRCSYSALTGDGSGCAPGICSAGLSATVVVGATAADISITSQMNSFTTETRDCAEIDSTYEGSYSLACEAQSLSSNTTGCSPVPVAGTTVEARQVVESAVAFNLPAVEATVDEMQAVMELPATKRAYELTLSESLGVPPEDVTVFSIQVYDSTAARRLQTSRRLQTKTSLAVNVNFQLRTKGSTSTPQDTQVAGLKSKIANLGSSGSTEQLAFASALGTNLEEASQVDPQGMALLKATAQAVQTEGVVVKHVETPRVSVTYVAVENVDTEEGNPMVVINVIAAVVGIMAAGACAALVIWQIRKRQVLTPVHMLDEDAVQEPDAEAPATPSSQPDPDIQDIRSAGQTSPQSLALRNAMNNTSVEPIFSPFGADPEPFWQDTPQEPAPTPARSPQPEVAHERMVTLDRDELVMNSVEDGSGASLR